MKLNVIKLIIFLFCLPLMLIGAESNPEANIMKANMMAEQGQYGQALKEIDAAIKKAPNSARAYKIRGHIYIAKEDYQKALADLGKVISLAHNQAKPYVDRAIVHFKMGNKGLAMSDISKALKINPSDPWTLGVGNKIANENP